MIWVLPLIGCMGERFRGGWRRRAVGLLDADGRGEPVRRRIISIASTSMKRTMSTADATLVPVARLLAWGEAVYAAVGCDAAEARDVATGLVDANRFGHDSHGIGMTPQYVDAVRAGRVGPGRRPRVVSDAGALVALDGQLGFGRTIGAAAMQLAIERARLHGCAVVALSNTHHLGRIGQWGERCAAAGLVSVHFVNVRSRAWVAPHGGLDARVSTNPFCVAVPHAPHPLVLDYATSAIALGKTRVAVDEGHDVAPGLLIDALGRPTTDPGVLWRGEPVGAIVPFAGHKGWALSVMCELLGGALTGGGAQDGNFSAAIVNNMLTLAFDPARLSTGSALEGEIASLARWVRASPPAEPGGGILLPGEPERRVAAARDREGVPVPRVTLRQLAACAESLGVRPLDG
jgi:uncharacterized oxidoreductase